MLSYQHDYHAGNFADVLKHVVLIQVLRHLLAKEKPILYVDTHAGSGYYALAGTMAQRLNESQLGIQRLRAHCAQSPHTLPSAITDYVSLIDVFNGFFNPVNTHHKPLTHYPGSPAIALTLLRSQDQLQLTEQHPQAFAALEAQLLPVFQRPPNAYPLPGASDNTVLRHALQRKPSALPRVFCQKADGYHQVKAVLPPKTGRACVLIDPSYEERMDDERVVAAIGSAHQRCAHAVCLLWYPVAQRARITRLERALQRRGAPNTVLYEFTVRQQPAHHEQGMTGTGMIVVNPPWGLTDKMRHALPFLSSVLRQDSSTLGAVENTPRWRIQTVTKESSSTSPSRHTTRRR